ncbi:MAG: hypothetical protein M0P59_04400 [Gallionella sp.]|jgi:hypothetical protein|nr:hypothetical protein [Gallionella sp.]MCK9353382.1 hypothetical protein [Gallionella sp.]
MEDYFVLVFVLLFLAWFIFLMFTKKGKGLFFGGNIVETIGDKVGSKRGIVNANVKVHVIETNLPIPNKYQVGLELSQSSVASYQMMPVTLSINEAKVLINMLNEAVNYENRT